MTSLNSMQKLPNYDGCYVLHIKHLLVIVYLNYIYYDLTIYDFTPCITLCIIIADKICMPIGGSCLVK